MAKITSAVAEATANTSGHARTNRCRTKRADVFKNFLLSIDVPPSGVKTGSDYLQPRLVHFFFIRRLGGLAR
jgi:hypothetical protein